MPKVTLAVSEEMAVLLKELERKLKAEAANAKQFGSVEPDGALDAIGKDGDALERDMKRGLLQGYDVDVPRLLINGKESTPGSAATKRRTRPSKGR